MFPPGGGAVPSPRDGPAVIADSRIPALYRPGLFFLVREDILRGEMCRSRYPRVCRLHMSYPPPSPEDRCSQRLPEPLDRRSADLHAARSSPPQRRDGEKAADARARALVYAQEPAARRDCRRLADRCRRTGVQCAVKDIPPPVFPMIVARERTWTLPCESEPPALEPSQRADVPGLEKGGRDDRQDRWDGGFGRHGE